MIRGSDDGCLSDLAWVLVSQECPSRGRVEVTHYAPRYMTHAPAMDPPRSFQAASSPQPPYGLASSRSHPTPERAKDTDSPCVALDRLRSARRAGEGRDASVAEAIGPPRGGEAGGIDDHAASAWPPLCSQPIGDEITLGCTPVG